MWVDMVIMGGVLGSMIGSFLNVVVYRLPLNRSVVAPSSACPQCDTAIRGYDNIPIVSWIALRGRCRSCQSAISVRYPLVELGTALFFAVVTWAFLPAITAPGSAALAASAFLVLGGYLYFAAVSVSLALIDQDTQTLPDRIVLPAYLVGAVVFVTEGSLNGDYSSLIQAAVGMGVMWLSYLIIFIVYPQGLGRGDVKLAGVIGLFLGHLGWQELIVGGFSAFVLGGIFGSVLLLTGKAGRKSGIPFGPWMLGGAWLGVFFGALVAQWYLSLFGLI